MYHEYRRGPDGRRRKFYCVQWPKVGQGRHRQYFKDFQEARKLRDQKQEERGKYGVAHLAFSDRQRIEYAECVELLRPFDKSLSDAVRHYVSHLEAGEKSCHAVQLVAELVAAKEKDGASQRHVDDLRSRLTIFANKFNGQPVATITTAEIDDWLRSLNVSAVTRNHYRRLIVLAFNFAVQRKYATANPAEKTAKAKESSGSIGILTVQQTARLLESATPDVLPYIAVGLFAGLRRAEIERLDWKEIDFESGLIEVTAKNSKTARRRHVTMQPNLREWLLPLRKHKGKVTPGENFRLLFEQARAAAGIVEWPENALRHGFASFHLAHFRDAKALALELGHTNEDMIFSNYRQLVKPKEAERYWSLAPRAEHSKVVHLAVAS